MAAPITYHRFAIWKHSLSLVLIGVLFISGRITHKVRGAVPSIPLPVLNWEFEDTTAEEVSRGSVWTLQDRQSGSPVAFGGWFSGGLTTNNWNNRTMLGNSQLPF